MASQTNEKQMARLQQAVEHHSRGEFTEAESLYRQVLQDAPGHPDALHLLGMIEYQRGNNDLAIELIGQAIQHTQSAPMFCNLGIVLLAQGKIEMALDSLHRAIDLDPRYLLSYTNMGYALKSAGRGDEAVHYLKKALALSPGQADIQVTLDMIRQENQVADAVSSHEQWMNAAPGNKPSDTLEPLGFQGFSYNIADMAKFTAGLELIKDSLTDKGASLFASDNMITWNRNYSFLREDFFLKILGNPAYTYTEKSVIWRTYVLLYFAEHASKASGDFAEIGCHVGHTVLQIIRKIDFRTLGKSYYLYDLFDWKEGDAHTRMSGHRNPRMYEDVVERFSEHDFVSIIKGSVPQSFAQGFPDAIAFAHIDMNHPVPEAAALEAVLPRLSRGGVVVLDDYGWWGYRKQKMALDPIIKKHDLSVLELPTGQGIILKA